MWSIVIKCTYPTKFHAKLSALSWLLPLRGRSLTPLITSRSNQVSPLASPRYRSANVPKFVFCVHASCPRTEADLRSIIRAPAANTDTCARFLANRPIVSAFQEANDVVHTKRFTSCSLSPRSLSNCALLVALLVSGGGA
jgi:hypothetical protein